MFGDFIGARMRKIREDVFDISQLELAEEVNQYMERRHGSILLNQLKFTQTVISLFENQSKIGRDRMIMMMNFMYNEKKINPSWIILEKNNSQPMYSTKLIIDRSLIQKQKDIKEYAEKINQTINDIAIVIDNSAFK
tara:strand:+ start:7008 stop:7418 length:411 start_codon:yes stop_codon:yes gene_type:complete